MNLLQISEALKGVPKQFLVQEATQPSGRYPQFMVVAELSRRTSMEKRFATAEAQMPAQTVAEQKVAEAAAPMPTSTTMAMGQMQPNMPSGMVPSEPIGQETMGMPAAVRMYEGGRIKANTGIFTGDGPYSDRYKDPEARAKLEADIRNREIELQSLKDSEQPEDSPAIRALEDQLEYSKSMLRQSSPTSVDLAALEGEVGNVLRGENITDAYIANQLSSDSGDVAAQEEAMRVVDDREANLKANEFGPQKGGYNINVGEAAGEALKPVAEADAIKAGTQDANTILATLKGEQVAPAVNNKSLVEQVFGPQEDREKKIKEFYTSKKENYEKAFKKDPEEVKFNLSETLKTQEGFNQERAKLRTKDYLAQLEANNLKEKQSIEKDKKLAVPLAMISAGLNIATTSSPNVWAALGEGGKEGLKQWMSVQKDARAAEQELRKAENNLALARDARQEGDLQAYDRYVENYNTKRFEADKLNYENARKIQQQIAENKKFKFKFYNELDVEKAKALRADETARATFNTQLIISDMETKAKSAAAATKFVQDMVIETMKSANNLVELEMEIGGELDIGEQILTAKRGIAEELKKNLSEDIRLQLQKKEAELEVYETWLRGGGGLRLRPAIKDE
jgi:hypothetical protein|tara:strand:+ start:210 stop:2087 length:1878 start_codon:yes stop_codon:yes gene_type:complete